VLLASATPVGSAAPRSPWPPFLGPRDTLPPEVVAAVEHVWLEPTLSRTVKGPTVRAPWELYVAFVDTPDITAAAARYLKLARYEVEAIDDDWYRATDNEGSRGAYRVLVRRPGRRVMLSWGEHSGSILGVVTGSALTVFDFEPTPAGIDQTLTAHVKIDNAVAARLARLLVAIFGYIADQKLSEGFRVTARVAEWAVARPDEFCEWLAREPLPSPRRARVQAAAACAG